jgi:hypothetical protein
MSPRELTTTTRPATPIPKPQQNVTSDHQRSALRRSDHPRPRPGQDGQSNDGERGRQQHQAEQDRREEHVVQVEERQVVPDPLHEEGRVLFDVKGSLLAEPKEDGGTSQVLPLEDVVERLLRRVRNARRRPAERVARPARLPLLLAGSTPVRARLIGEPRIEQK